VQIAGKPFQEAKVLQVADAFEKATAFRAKRPAMVG
jgi:Asp-tRNA(Asn)/Glu-tRNA(Gln) amidotransferase A subunit family amidase